MVRVLDQFSEGQYFGQYHCWLYQLCGFMNYNTIATLVNGPLFYLLADSLVSCLFSHTYLILSQFGMMQGKAFVATSNNELYFASM